MILSHVPKSLITLEIILLAILSITIGCEQNSKLRLEASSDLCSISKHSWLPSRFLVITETECSGCLINEFEQIFSAELCQSIYIHVNDLDRNIIYDEFVNQLNTQCDTIIYFSDKKILEKLAILADYPISPYVIDTENNYIVKVEPLYR